MLHGDLDDVSTVSSELVVARLFAAAASHRCTESDTVTIELRLLGAPSEWDRRASDAFFLCLDRAVARVYPPLDPLQYLQSAPELTTLDSGERLARLRITPTARHFPSGCTPLPPTAAAHLVEGCAIESAAAIRAATQSASAVDALWDTVRAAKDCASTAVKAEGSRGNDAAMTMAVAMTPRERWRLAAWLTARFFNEASWCSGSARSAVDAAARKDGRRVLHVDVAGMEVAGRIVGVTPRYAYIAVPLAETEAKGPLAETEAKGPLAETEAKGPLAETEAKGPLAEAEVFDGNAAAPWALVARVPIPAALACGPFATGNSAHERKRPRSADCSPNVGALLHAADVMLHDAGPLRCLPPRDQLRVVLRAHKAHCTHGSGSGVGVGVVLEDAALIDCSAAVGLNSYADVLDIVRESGARFVRGYERHRSALSSSASTDGTARLFAAMTDTASVRFRKARGRDGRPPLLISSPRDIPALREGPCVEFKAAVAEWRGAGTALTTKATTITDAERIRHTIAAMASTLGGVLFVGVADDGAVIGHTRREAPALRLGGFCPAMVKGAVAAAEMRVTNNNNNNNNNNDHNDHNNSSNNNNSGGGSGDSSGKGDPLPPASLPREWWKGAGGTRGAEERIVTIVSVAKGQAPFYATSRRSAPYVRGFASTVPMPIVVCAQRVAQLLPLDH